MKLLSLLLQESQRWWQRSRQSAVPWILLTALLRMAGVLLVLPITLRTLPSEHLGLWYLFLSTTALAGLIDLGIFSSANRAISYLWAGAVDLQEEGLVASPPEGTPPNYALLKDLARTLTVYYTLLGAVTYLLTALGAGWWIWNKIHMLPEASFLMGAWGVYCFGGFLNSVGMIWPSMLNGINGVRQAQQITVVGILISYGVTLGLLGTGADLYALVLGHLAMAMFVRSAGRYWFLHLAGEPYRQAIGRVNWNLLKKLWPTAWRQGLGGIGIFLTLQANTLICTQFLDLKTTASYGFSLQVVQALAGFSVVWIQAKMPEITALRARNAIHQIVGVFAPRMHLTLLTYLVGALFLIGAGPFFVQAIHAGTPLLPVPLLLALLVISGLEMHHSLYMQLVLTENRNPFLALSLVTGAGIVLGSLWLTPLYGVAGILLAQGLVQACGNNWWPVHRAARGLGGRMYWMAFFRQAERT